MKLAFLSVLAAVLAATSCPSWASSAATPRPASRERGEDAGGSVRAPAAQARQLAHAAPTQPRARRGVVLDGDDQPGVRITGVTPGWPADRGGLRAGDRLVSIDGVAVLGNTGELRLRNARELLRRLQPGTTVEIGYRRGSRDSVVALQPDGRRRALAFSTADGRVEWLDRDAIAQGLDAARDGLQTASVALDSVPGIASDVRREIQRISREGACRGGDCTPGTLLSALRWHGLNLASVDAKLGRYFGTDHGVLVLSSGELEGLEPGDVIQRVDGRPVRSPREVMVLLRDRDAGSKVRIDYLRDRRQAQAQVAVPRIPALPAPPPAPPAPPKPPTAPSVPTPPAPPGAARAAAAGRLSRQRPIWSGSACRCGCGAADSTRRRGG